MADKSYSSVANGLSLTNEAIYNFAEAIGSADIRPGLFDYTTNNSFRLKNGVMFNYNGGSMGRYGYGGSVVHPNIAMRNGKVLGNGILYDPILINPFIGDGYVVPDEMMGSNSIRHFMTEASFTELNQYLRAANTYNNVEWDYYRLKKYSGESGAKFVASGMPYEMTLGTEYVQNVHNGEEHEALLYKEADNLARAKAYSRDGQYYSDGRFLKYKDFTNRTEILGSQRDRYEVTDVRRLSNAPNLTETGGERREWLKRFYIENKFVTTHKNAAINSDHEIYGEDFGDSYIIKDITDFETKFGVDGGLYALSNKWRNNSASAMRTWSDNCVFGWRSGQKAYGISSQIKDEVYTVDGKNNFDGNVEINSEYTDGQLRKTKNGSTNYSYFEETDSDGTANIKKTIIADDSSVKLDTFNSASRLLKKTNKLFRDNKIGSLVNRFHTSKVDLDSELITAYDNTYGMSRGRNLLKKDPTDNAKETGYDNPYCRVWTAHKQYATLGDRIRPFVKDGSFESIAELQKNLGDLRPANGAERLNDGSVLQSNGFVRMTPTHHHNSADDVKKCMFSLENLAWKDVPNLREKLTPEQVGPNGGRIMWFPPYNLKFTENVNTSWQPHDFIGRGEKIYTYTNTDRSGTLNFTLLIDHPSIVNKWRGTTQNVSDKDEAQQDLLRFFAGCGDLNEDLSDALAKETEEAKQPERKILAKPNSKTKEIAYVIFFPNDFSAYDYIGGKNKSMKEALAELDKYETAAAVAEYSKRDDSYKNEILLSWNLTNTASKKIINEELDEETANSVNAMLFGYEQSVIKTYMDIKNLAKDINDMYGLGKENVKVGRIKIKGFASSHGYKKNNIELCRRRRETMKQLLLYYCKELADVTFIEEDGSIIEMDKPENVRDINALDAKIARSASAIIELDWDESTKASQEYTDGVVEVRAMAVNTDGEVEAEEPPMEVSVTKTENEEVYRYENEYLYFSDIADTESKMVYQNIIDKVKYFSPAFHSITPEGFNARLTFLHQCTRQGPTNEVQQAHTDSTNYVKYAGNLAFGRAPYCILRIGDFFLTKICIDSMSIDYDNGGGIQWDLNPEGAGVQPMMANVSINFHFIGGQDLGGPIERLQNAISSNYYANTSVYDQYADYKNPGYVNNDIRFK